MSSTKVSTSTALQFSAHPKMGTKLLQSIKSKTDLSLAYTPGIAEVSHLIQTHPQALYTHTFARNNLAVISDGSAVLGLGNIGHKAAMPVMEGKAMLFKRFGAIDAIPLIINTQDPDEFVTTVTHIADSFAAINLEDISAPRCFDIETRLVKELSIPVMHDDQHGTAIVVLSALKNALALLPKAGKQTHIVVSGVGAAGVAITHMLINAGFANLTLVDSQGIISHHRQLEGIKHHLAGLTNKHQRQGSLADALKDAHVFIGVSKGNLLTPQLIKLMAKDPIIFAMANPTPEIMPDVAYQAGAGLVATGRSDFPNQINNALAFPGIFRGAIDARSKITEKIKLAASNAIVSYHQKSLSPRNLLPSILDTHIHQAIAQTVFKAASQT